MELGPGHGTLTLHTGRAGAAAKVGHDLVIAVNLWSATVEPGESASLVADLSSLEVLKGDGGLKPLSDKDKATILDNAAKTLKAKDHPTITATVVGTEGALTARVTIAGETRDVPLTVEVGDGDPAAVTVTATITQTQFGIKPYSGLMGQLKVADDVRILLDLKVPR